MAVTRCSPGSAAAAPSSPPCGPRTLWAVSSPPRGAPHCGTAAGWAALRPPPADPTSSPWTDPMGGRGGNGVGAPQPRAAQRRLWGPTALRSRFCFPSMGAVMGSAGLPLFVGRGVRFVFFGVCAPHPPPPHTWGAQGWGSPRPQLWVQIPLYGAALPPHRLLETPFPPFASLLYREPTELYFQPRLFFQSRRRPTACGAAVGPRGRDGIVRRSRWGRCLSHKPAFISRPYSLPYRKPYSTAPAATA